MIKASSVLFKAAAFILAIASKVCLAPKLFLKYYIQAVKDQYNIVLFLLKSTQYSKISSVKFSNPWVNKAL